MTEGPTITIPAKLWGMPSEEPAQIAAFLECTARYVKRSGAVNAGVASIILERLAQAVLAAKDEPKDEPKSITIPADLWGLLCGGEPGTLRELAAEDQVVTHPQAIADVRVLLNKLASQIEQVRPSLKRGWYAVGPEGHPLFRYWTGKEWKDEQGRYVAYEPYPQTLIRRVIFEGEVGRPNS